MSTITVAHLFLCISFFVQIVGTVGIHGTSISSALLISATSLSYPAPLAGRKA